MTRWTHALRRPGPHPDRCVVGVGLRDICGCDVPIHHDLVTNPRLDAIELCAACGHELVPAFSGRPSDSPEPPR